MELGIGSSKPSPVQITEFPKIWLSWIPGTLTAEGHITLKKITARDTKIDRSRD